MGRRPRPTPPFQEFLAYLDARIAKKEASRAGSQNVHHRGLLETELVELHVVRLAYVETFVSFLEGPPAGVGEGCSHT